MKKKFFKIFAVLLLFAMVAAAAWYKLDFARRSVAGAGPFEPRQVRDKDAVNVEKLGELLKNENLRVESSTLLPAQVERSRTLQVRLETTTAEDFAEQMNDRAVVSLLGVKTDAGELTRKRFLELSPTLILIVALNEQRQVLWWNTQPDPRILRADTVDAENRVTGKTLYRNDAAMLISVPSEQAITELNFYQPIWDGKSSYALKNIGSLNINNRSEGNQ